MTNTELRNLKAEIHRDLANGIEYDALGLRVGAEVVPECETHYSRVCYCTGNTHPSVECPTYEYVAVDRIACVGCKREGYQPTERSILAADGKRYSWME